MKNIKDIATNIAGGLGFAGGAILALAGVGVVFAAPVVAAAGGAVALSTFIIGWFSGKNPDGSSKTPTQVTTQNEETKK